MSVRVKGIARWPRLVKPGAPKDYPLNLKYGVDVLIHKSDPQLPKLQEQLRMATLKDHPRNLPYGYKSCLIDLELKEPDNVALKDYFYLKTRSKADFGKVPVANADRTLNKDEELDFSLTGQLLVIAGDFFTYKDGISFLMKAVMLTHKEGPIHVDNLSSKKSAETIIENAFSDIDLEPAPQQIIVSSPPAPPASPTSGSTYVMTPKAAGSTREAFVALGWTDEGLIREEYMLPPGGITPSFM